MAKQQDREAAERERNGGKTNAELADELEASLQTQTEQMIAEATECALHDMLTKFGFEQSMQHHFYHLESWSDGQLRVLKEIAAKKLSGARKNSNAYKEAVPEAASLVDSANALITKFHAEREQIKARIVKLRHG